MGTTLSSGGRGCASSHFEGRARYLDAETIAGDQAHAGGRRSPQRRGVARERSETSGTKHGGRGTGTRPVARCSMGITKHTNRPDRRPFSSCHLEVGGSCSYSHRARPRGPVAGKNHTTPPRRGGMICRVPTKNYLHVGNNGRSQARRRDSDFGRRVQEGVGTVYPGSKPPPSAGPVKPTRTDASRNQWPA